MQIGCSTTHLHSPVSAGEHTALRHRSDAPVTTFPFKMSILNITLLLSSYSHSRGPAECITVGGVEKCEPALKALNHVILPQVCACTHMRGKLKFADFVMEFGGDEQSFFTA